MVNKSKVVGRKFLKCGGSGLRMPIRLKIGGCLTNNKKYVIIKWNAKISPLHKKKNLDQCCLSLGRRIKKHQALKNDAWRSKKGVKKIMIAYKRLV